MGAALQDAQERDQPLPEAEASLMPSMIENSDNASATALLSDVGGASALTQFDHSIGMTATVPSSLALIPGTSLPGWGLTTTSALDEVTLMSKFAYPNTTLSTSSRNYGLGLMEQVETDQDWGVSAGASAGYNSGAEERMAAARFLGLRLASEQHRLGGRRWAQLRASCSDDWKSD